VSIRHTTEKIVFIIITSLISQQIYSCENKNTSWESMEESYITLQSDSGQIYEILVKLAINEDQRRFGFQYVCEQSINQWGILFVFPSSVRRTFHMQNVEAPLALAFFRKDGKMISLKVMRTETQERANYLYQIRNKFRYALEMSIHQMMTLGLDEGQWFLTLDSRWHAKHAR
tara:strand:- start:2167 stop:2685 length:519 start_codon:yes stop_codon:yes gene_type:complete